MDEQETAQKTVQKVAQECVDATSSIQEAQNRLKRLTLEDSDLHRRVTAHLLDQACYDAVRAVHKGNRQKIWAAPNYTQGGNGHRLKTMAVTLLDFPLPNGVKLGDATGAQVIEAAEFYRKQAADMRNKAIWLKKVSECLDTGEKVRDNITHQQLEAMKRSS